MVRQVAEKLRQGGLRVWFDEWCVKPGQLIGKMIEQGLDQSRILVLAMSKAAFDSDWVTLEAQAAIFRDPANRGRGFIPIRLYDFEDSQIPRMLRSFKYVDVFRDGYESLLSACRLPHPVDFPLSSEATATKTVKFGRGEGIIQQMLHDRLSESFQVEEVIHADDDEVVFRARDKNLDRNVAIKVPHLPSHDANLVAEKFYRKIKAISVINHSNIIPVHAGFLLDHLPILVMGYVPGVDLETLMRRTGAQPLRRVRDLLRHVGDALLYSHRLGAIHHRVRPRNIIYDMNGQLMLTPMNFGQLEEPTSDDNRAAIRRFEQLKYEPPERITRDEIADKSDQYSLGLIAYEMLKGKPYHTASDYYELRHEKITGRSRERQDSDLETDGAVGRLLKIIYRMLQRRPENRYSSFLDLLKDVDALSDSALGLKRAVRRGMKGTKPTANAEQILRVHESLQRCRVRRDFFRQFYSRLLQNPDIKEVFHTHSRTSPISETQQRLLREGLDLLISYVDEGNNTRILEKIRQSHQRYKMKREHFEHFVDSLLATVEIFDPEMLRGENARNQILDAWRRVMNPGILYLQRPVAERLEGSE